MGSRLAAARIDDSSAIEVILVDCEIGLINALDFALPTAQTLICVWHINKAVMGNIREIVSEVLLLWKVGNPAEARQESGK